MEVVFRRVSSSTFVGRADELAALDAAVGRMPAFAFVAGESGIGKSRLVSEFEARAEVPVLVGHCLELGGTTFPYAPLAEALRPLGEPVPDAGSQAQVFEALLALFARLGPVALVIEDLHWADPSTRDFLVFLVRNARTEPIFLLATYRSDELHRRHPLRPVLAELERAPRVERLALERFSRHEVTEQLAGILGGEPDPGLADRLYARAQGNALYTEELLAASADTGELPATLRDALLDRFERLPSAAQEVVRVAAVAERPIGHALLEAVLDGDVDEGAREAVAHQLLVAHTDDTYAFRHALVGEAIYEDLLPGERTALHAALARAIEGDPSAPQAELACHWHGAHDLPRALAASVAAGLESQRLHAPGEALRQLEDALALWDRVPDAAERAGLPRTEVLLAAAAAANDGFESGRAIALQREAIASAADADPVALSGMHAQLAHYLRHANQHDASDEEVRLALELLPRDARLERARLRDQSSKSLMLRGHFREAALEAQETSAEARRLGALDLEAGAANTEMTIELALREGRLEDARAAAERGLPLIEGTEEGGRLVKLLWGALMVEADAAARPGTPVDEELAATLRARLATAVSRPGQWAEGPRYAALAEAEVTRLEHALGRDAPDPGAWLAAAAGFDEIRLPEPAAYARLRAAEAFVAAGDRAAAAEPLTAVLAAATTMEAAVLAGDARALARRARVRIEEAAPEPEPAAPLGLTPREHEVLLLVAEGLTNREIGERLYMSEKTASVHVSRILAKLEVGGRVEAAAVAHRLGLSRQVPPSFRRQVG